MPSQVKALGRGIGTLADISACLSNLPASDIGFSELIKDACLSLHELLQDERFADSALAIACGVLNSRFRDTGDLWRLADKGNMDKNYIGPGAGRDAIADLAGL